MKQSKDAVSEEVANLEARERDMIQKLNSESGSLASQIDVKQDEVKRLEDMGVSRFVLPPPGFTPDQVSEGLEKLGNEIISKS